MIIEWRRWHYLYIHVNKCTKYEKQVIKCEDTGEVID